MRPQPSEYARQAAGYVDQIPEEDILAVLNEQLSTVPARWHMIPQSSAETIHPPYSWTVKQVLHHINDAERIFGYRLLRIARRDQTPLPGFEENDFAESSMESRLTLAEIASEFAALRASNLLVLKSLPESGWTRTGITSGSQTSVRGLAYILAGHVRHHDNILQQRMR